MMTPIALTILIARGKPSLHSPANEEQQIQEVSTITSTMMPLDCVCVCVSEKGGRQFDPVFYFSQGKIDTYRQIPDVGVLVYQWYSQIGPTLTALDMVAPCRTNCKSEATVGSCSMGRVCSETHQEMLHQARVQSLPARALS